MLNGLLAVALAAIGLTVVGYLGGLLWRAVLGPLSGVIEQRRLARCERLAARGDVALQQGNTAQALKAFVDAVYVSPVNSAALAAAVDKHHIGLLSRFIAVSDRRFGENLGSLSLAIADRVLRQRKQLQSSYSAALQTGDQRRRREIATELRANARELRKAMTDLAREVLQRDPEAPVH